MTQREDFLREAREDQALEDKRLQLARALRLRLALLDEAEFDEHLDACREFLRQADSL